jgi:citrate synthase
VPSHVFDVIDSFPSYAHPMTMFVAAVMALQTEGHFVKEYAKGLNKKDYWNPTYDDTMDLIARLPRIAAYVYRRKYKNDEHIQPNGLLDWAGNFAHMLGYEDEVSRINAFVHDHSCRCEGVMYQHIQHLVNR